MQLFHLGYPKSGSTTIQALLHADKTINFLGKPYRTREAEEYVRRYLPYSDLRLVPAALLAAMRRELCEGAPIISEELLSGVGFRHGIASNSLLQVVDNIDLLTEGQFVAQVVFRRPADFLRSYYGQIAKMGGRLTFDQFCSLVLLRRHQWVLQALNFRAILHSAPARSGKLQFALFEQLFAGKGLNDYLRSTFGMTTLPEDAASLFTNMSDTDSALDHAAPNHPVNPANSLEIQVTQPSLQEHAWIDGLPDADRSMHLSLWLRERGEAVAAQEKALQNMERSRVALSKHRGKRPLSPIFRHLLAEIAALNAGLDEDFPELGFGKYRYFEVPAA